MAKRTYLGVIAVAGAWAICGAVLGHAQSTPSAPPDNTAPCSVTPQPDPCGSKPAAGSKSSPTEKFPFPGEPGAPAANPSPGLSGAPDAPATPDAPQKKDAAKDFPFPGEPAKGAPIKSDSSTGSSSSSSDDDASPVDPGAPAAGGAPGMKDEGSTGSTATPGRHLLHRVNPVGSKLQSTEEREAEDLDIAHYYTQTGNLQGAYLRSKDAVTLVPNDADAHFALAETALKLNKKDEAIAEYSACLKLDASDKEIKESRKALARLKP
jgi:hypothetical protein